MRILGFQITKDNKKNNTRIIKQFKNRGEYKIVDSSSNTIASSSPEYRNEDEILDSNKRARLLDITRNLVRNSSLFNTILGQLTTNVVSVNGGKVVLNYKDNELNQLIRSNFYAFTRNADFTTGQNFNHLLKRILREYIIGGECVLVFDNNLVENSGKVILFESNEIVNVSPEVIKKHYGIKAYQRQGKVYNKNGRHIGTVVSKSSKNDTVADESKCWFLKRNPNSSPLSNDWYHFSCNYRAGRGISQAASAIGTLHQLEDLVTSELMASRRNSQIFCWLTQAATKQEDEALPSAFDTNTDFDSMTDDEINNAVNSEVEEVKTISFQRAKENSVVYEALPEGIDAKQLTTSHPNTNVQVMVDWLANRCASTLGLSKLFATGNPEDSNWRANQLFSYPAILEFQKDLEQICDWVFFRFCKWLVDSDVMNDEVLNDIMPFVSWTWKTIDELDPVANENAIALKLKNHTSSYKEILGNDWKEKLMQCAYENKWMIENGITPPSELMISGGQTEASKII